MKHLEVDGWSRRSSPLHRLDARAKLATVLVMLAFIGSARPWTARHGIFYGGLAMAAAFASRLSWRGLARRLTMVLPFPLVFAGMSWLASGDAADAAGLVTRSITSAAFALILIGVTTAPALLDGAARLGVPAVLISVTQLLYRYLFVLFDQSVRLRNAAACRGGFRWSAAAGAAAALFASSEDRAERIHRAMVARGHHGAERLLTQTHWRRADTCLLIATLAVLLAARLLWRL